MNYITPPRLKKGDCIGIVSPSHLVRPGSYDAIFRVLERLGYRLKIGQNLYADSYGYAASERERADDFNSMIDDDDVKMILFGGGEGGNELLPYLHYDRLRENPKLLCSYSDGTSILNAVNTKCRIVTYYGPGPGQFNDLRYFDYCHFAANFFDEVAPAKEFEQNTPWQVVHEGHAKGLTIGGYLELFAMMIGREYRDYDPAEKYILFLEDHEKFHKPNALSAFISAIEQSEFFSHVSGLVFGHYSSDEYPEVMARLSRIGEAWNIPVVYTHDFGHGKDHGIFPIGVRAELDGVAGRLFWDAPEKTCHEG